MFPLRDAKVTHNFFEHNPLNRLPPPRYSLDISPLDFDLFRKVKNTLIGQEIPDEIALLESATEILYGRSGNELQAVFRNWIEPDQGVIYAHGSYLS
jgi:hypothetical protein